MFNNWDKFPFHTHPILTSLIALWTSTLSNMLLYTYTPHLISIQTLLLPLQIQPYHQRSFSERHHQSSTTHVSSGGYINHNNNNKNHNSTPATIIPTGNQFIRGHSYRNSDTSELSEKNYHISSASMNSRHFESLMTSTHHVTSSAYDKIFQ